MSLIRTSPPAVLAVAEEDVWDHLRLIAVDGEPVDRDHVRRLIEAAVGELDGPDGRLGRCLINQTWMLRLDSWSSAIELPLPPVFSVSAITYVDEDGETATLDPDAYAVIGLGDLSPAKVIPLAPWPALKRIPEAVAVSFVAGFGPFTDNVPPAIRQAIMERVATLYAFREGVSTQQAYALPGAAADAVAQYRRIFL